MKLLYKNLMSFIYLRLLRFSFILSVIRKLTISLWSSRFHLMQVLRWFYWRINERLNLISLLFFSLHSWRFTFRFECKLRLLYSFLSTIWLVCFDSVCNISRRCSFDVYLIKLWLRFLWSFFNNNSFFLFRNMLSRWYRLSVIKPILLFVLWWLDLRIQWRS